MKTIAWFLVAGLSISAVAVAAENAKTAVQPIVVAGFTAYKTHGVEAAMLAWTAGGPLQGNREAHSRDFRQVEASYGEYQTYHLVQTVVISETCEITYAQVDYASGPLFLKFLLFKGKNGWRTVQLRFHAEIEQVWPSNLWSGS